jgi:putative membrane protein
MLVRPKRSFPGTMLQIRGTALLQILPWLLALVAWAALVSAMYTAWDLSRYSLTITPFTLIGLALSIFLGFRNNACYDRWWEGRKLWGQLINTSRSVARQTLTLVGGPREEQIAVEAFRRELVRRQIAYVYALKAHLRTRAGWDELKALLDPEEVESLARVINVPNAIVLETGRLYRQAFDRGWVDRMHLPVLEESLTRLLDIQGGCERIKKTPVPLSYTILTHRIVGVYCVSLPFGIAETVGWMTPAVVALVAFAFLGLDDVGTQLEDPFEEDANDLPLHAMCVTIDRDLRQMIGESEVPDEVAAVHGILL